MLNGSGGKFSPAIASPCDPADHGWQIRAEWFVHRAEYRADVRAIVEPDDLHVWVTRYDVAGLTWKQFMLETEQHHIGVCRLLEDRDAPALNCDDLEHFDAASLADTVGSFETRFDQAPLVVIQRTKDEPNRTGRRSRHLVSRRTWLTTMLW